MEGNERRRERGTGKSRRMRLTKSSIVERWHESKHYLFGRMRQKGKRARESKERVKINKDF